MGHPPAGRVPISHRHRIDTCLHKTGTLLTQSFRSPDTRGNTVISRIFCLAALATLFLNTSASSASDAPQPDDADGALPSFVRAEHGARSCWKADISPSELAAEPHRTVKSVALSMQTEFYPPDAFRPRGQFLYNYDLSIAFSDGRRGRTLGNCIPHGPDSIACSVECDGGGAIVSHGAAGAVDLDFGPISYIRLNYCGEEGEAIRFRPEAVEARFMLRKRPGEECPAVTTPDWDAGID